ncbi:hypothetical protein Agub_g3477 [Astrephomene gubernaculifera]|uniref:Peptide-methionine (S)-S-oxide reductase n=1 Tax=Astrephomene gubernaculifera TaxID=47775 RepID=A0AAD3HJA9_9CHLO|nr:hypothetical protein Agub_g3477 [Astrephomene gubernaculifera]
MACIATHARPAGSLHHGCSRHKENMRTPGTRCFTFARVVRVAAAYRPRSIREPGPCSERELDATRPVPEAAPVCPSSHPSSSSTSGGAAAVFSALRCGLACAALAACLLLPPPPAAAAASGAAEEGVAALQAAGPPRGTAAVATSVPSGDSSALQTAGNASSGTATTDDSSSSGLQTVYFGNGCFWGRQRDFAEVELRQLGRPAERVTALVGYAGGNSAGPGGRVCYVYGDPRTRYDMLGHAEVVQLGVSSDPRVGEAELHAFASLYFRQFRPIEGGMDRLDPQDRGPAYRNVIGIPGGVRSPLFHVIQEENKYGMVLREGRGNDMERGRPTEDDVLNSVWVVDSDQLPFHRAERYHQFHHGLGKLFPLEYVRDLRNAVAGAGRMEPTGCPELPF